MIRLFQACSSLSANCEACSDPYYQCSACDTGYETSDDEEDCVSKFKVYTHWVHDVVATLNQRQGR